MKTKQKLCPEDLLQRLLGVYRNDQIRALVEIDCLLGEYSGDPRLLFLKGSLLAAREDYAGARSEMKKALQAAPDYAVARFQLGFLELTSGEARLALETWGPLQMLPADNYLRLFAGGLTHLIRDEFEAAERLLADGISHNSENEPMNGDMRLLIEEMRRRPGDGTTPPGSAVDMLLRQASFKRPN
jgi:tetratricopeptide (TPR) repeat protein